MNIAKKNFKIILFFLALSFLFSQVAFAGTFLEIMKGFSSTGREAGYPRDNSGIPAKTFGQTLAIYVNGFAAAMSAFFLILIIYSGFLWMTARGNEEQVKRAKTWIIQAATGLFIVIVARLIVELVLFYLGNIIYPS